MYVTKHLDWTSFTISQGVSCHMAFPLLRWRKLGNGTHGYRAQFVDDSTGMVCQCWADDPNQGDHYTVSGSTLEALRRDFGATDQGFTNNIVRLGATASRIDLTLNIHEGLLTPRIVYDATKGGKLHAKANTYRFIEGKRGESEGDTLYIGAPKSDRQFRCYNKAAELGIVDEGAWVRLELELRRTLANGALQSCVFNGVAETVTAHIRDFIEWRQHEFNAAVGANGVGVADRPRKDTNRQRWLLGQVAVALAKECETDVSFMQRFTLSVLEAQERLHNAD